MKINPIALVILDGFGYSPEIQYNAIAHAKKPFIDFAMKNYPHTLLDASGPAVGLPPGYVGNSGVGHTTIGAGRRIPSAFLQLMESIENKTFFSQPVLISHLKKLAQAGQALHILGVCSDAGVHGHMAIILATIQAALEQKIKKIVIHAFLDGQDVTPKSAPIFLNQIQNIIDENPSVTIGSITGRWYAMDRDKHIQRTGAIFAMLTQAKKPEFNSWQSALEYYYQKNLTDAFIPPTLLEQSAVIKEGNGLIFTNFRKERERQLVGLFLDSKEAPKFTFLITPILYAPTFNNPTLLKPHLISNTLKEQLTNKGKSIFSIAETEKYAHITFFFDGGREYAFPGETRILIPSSHVANFALSPEMAAQEITHAVITSLETDPKDFYLINYANADMVGHSGDFKATIHAIEFLDQQLKKLYDTLVIKMNGTLIITADHGKAEKMYDEKSQQPYPGHTTNKVPFILIKNDLWQKKIDLDIYELADIAKLSLKQFNS